MTSDENAVVETKRKRPVRRWIGNILLIMAVFAAIQWWQARPLASGPAPDLRAQLASGEPVALDQYLGKTVLVHFWATWCPVCRMGDQDIDAIAEDFHVVSVAMQSGGSREISSYMGAEGLDFPVVLDEHGHLASDWGVPGVPASFVVDREGQIRSSTLGYTTEIGLRARLWAAQ